ncbi:MAG: radical SAM protein [Planctomycetes bacterium]|nr:radical SAM protein [Planctomycetota bacterium]
MSLVVHKGRADLFVGGPCNNYCRVCYHGDGGPASGVMSRDEVIAALGTLALDGRVELLVFNGGEPTLRADLPQLVRAAKDLAFRSIRVQTNGRRLGYHAYARELVDAGVSDFAVALHGPRAEVHEFLTRVPGSFRQTVAGIRNARGLGAAVIVECVVTRANYRQAPEIARFAHRLGATALRFTLVRPEGRARALFPSLVPNVSLAAPYVREAVDLALGRGLAASAAGFPLCVLPAAAGEVAARRAIGPAEAGLSGGGVFGPPCAACRLRAACGGVHPAYAETFGWREFAAVD